MSLILSNRIRDRELGKRVSSEDREAILRSARVALAIPIAGQGLPSGTRLLKAYATSANGPRRIVYLLDVGGGDVFLLFYRGKNDPVGKNITIRNPAFKTQLLTYLRLLREDIGNHRYEVIETADS
jgi:hypothetical protein